MIKGIVIGSFRGIQLAAAEAFNTNSDEWHHTENLHSQGNQDQDTCRADTRLYQQVRFGRLRFGRLMLRLWKRLCWPSTPSKAASRHGRLVRRAPKVCVKLGRMPWLCRFPWAMGAKDWWSVKEKNRKYVQTKLAYRNCKNLLEIREENLFVKTNWLFWAGKWLTMRVSKYKLSMLIVATD